MDKINKKVLVSAYACEPGKGSEPAVGWSFVKQISSFVDEVWVITRANNRQIIKQHLANYDFMSNVHWVYFDLPKWMRFWKKGNRGIQLYYYLWQIGIYFLAKKLHRKINFDLIHHITFVNYWKPSFLSLLPVPFIWGPVGGGESTPKQFYKTFSLRGRLYEYIREFAKWIGEHDPFVRMTAKKSAVAIAPTKETAYKIKKLGARNMHILSQVVLDERDIEFLSNLPDPLNDKFRVISIGNLLHLKGFHLGLQAFALFSEEHPNSEYWIVGDGPERKNLEKLADKLKIRDKVKFWGKLPRNDTFEKLGQCHVLLHPSLHDSGGFVCAEAITAGRPVICLDIGGPALQVLHGETGFKIPAHVPKQAVEEMVKSMIQLVEDNAMRIQMGEKAKEAEKKAFSWKHRGRELTKIFEGVLYRV